MAAVEQRHANSGHRTPLAIAVAVNEPGGDRQDNADGKSDECTLERVPDRQTKEESEQDEDREETAAGAGIAWHVPLMPTE